MLKTAEAKNNTRVSNSTGYFSLGQRVTVSFLLTCRCLRTPELLLTDVRLLGCCQGVLLLLGCR